MTLSRWDSTALPSWCLRRSERRPSRPRTGPRMKSCTFSTRVSSSVLKLVTLRVAPLRREQVLACGALLPMISLPSFRNSADLCVEQQRWCARAHFRGPINWHQKCSRQCAALHAAWPHMKVGKRHRAPTTRSGRLCALLALSRRRLTADLGSLLPTTPFRPPSSAGGNSDARFPGTRSVSRACTHVHSAVGERK